MHINLKASTHTWYKISQHVSIFVILCKALSGHCRAGRTILIGNGSRGARGARAPPPPTWQSREATGGHWPVLRQLLVLVVHSYNKL